MAWDAHVKQGPSMSRGADRAAVGGRVDVGGQVGVRVEAGRGRGEAGCGGALKLGRRVEGGLSALQPEGGVAAHREKRPRFLVVDEDRKGRA